MTTPAIKVQQKLDADVASANRLAWLDCLRLTAGVSMVILHCTADPTGGAWADYPVEERVFPLILRTFAYAARTELFIIISLFLLLLSLQRRPKSYAATIAEQSRRLLIPFAFWTVFFALYSLIKAHHFGYLSEKVAALSDLKTWAEFLLLGSSKYHMHFLPTLFFVILTYPLMRKSIEAPMLGAFALLFCLVARWQLDHIFYARLWDDPMMPAIGRTIKIATHVGYGMVAGACLGLWQQASKAKLESWLLPTLYFGSLLFAFKLISTWQTIEAGRWHFGYAPGFWADFTMPALLFATCLMLGHRKWSAFFSKFAKYAFGLYLCHPIFLDLVEISLKHTEFSPWQQVSIKIVVTLVSTGLFIVSIAKTRSLGWTIGLASPAKSADFFISRRSFS